jgi:hypothetical protein
MIELEVFSMSSIARSTSCEIVQCLSFNSLGDNGPELGEKIERFQKTEISNSTECFRTHGRPRYNTSILRCSESSGKYSRTSVDVVSQESNITSSGIDHLFIPRKLRGEWV